LAAAVIGFFCVRLSSIYFAMLTLAAAQIAYAIVHQWYDVTGGDNGLLGIWPAPWLASPIRYYYLALAACGAGLAALAAADRAPFGLTLRAARDHARRAEAVGIDVRAHQWLAFVVAGFFGGLAGGTFAFLKGSVFPELLAVPVSVEPLVMVLLGGVHSLAGAPLGAALYKLLDTVVRRYTECQPHVPDHRHLRHPHRAGERAGRAAVARGPQPRAADPGRAAGGGAVARAARAGGADRAGRAAGGGPRLWRSQEAGARDRAGQRSRAP